MALAPEIWFHYKQAGVKRELLDIVKAMKLAYYGHTMRKQGSCLGKEIMQGTMPGALVHTGEEDHTRPGWTTSIRGQDSVEESIRVTEDRDKWRKYVHCVANPRSRTDKEETEQANGQR